MSLEHGNTPFARGLKHVAFSLPPPSSEEITRRRRVFAETFAFRARLKPLDLTVAELLDRDADQVEA